MPTESKSSRRYRLQPLPAEGVAALKARDAEYDSVVWGQFLDGKNGPKPRLVNPKRSPLPYDPFMKRRSERLKKLCDRHGHVNGETAMFDIATANHRVRVWNVGKLKDMLLQTDLPENAAFREAVAAIGKWKLTPDAAIELLHKSPTSEESRDLLKRIKPEDPLRELRRLLIECPNNRNRKLLRRRIREATDIMLVELDEHELGIDIDAKDGTPRATQAAWRLAGQIVDDLFTVNGIRAFVEPSRSRTGVYIRVRIRRTSGASEFNLLLDQLTKHLKTFTDPDGLANVCKVGRLAYWQVNPAFDEAAFNETPSYPFDDDDTDYIARNSVGESYEINKAYAEIEQHGRVTKPWHYDVRFERHLLIGCDLLTAPLHGLVRDPDGGAERLATFRSFRSDPASIISEDQLRAILPVVEDDDVKNETVSIGCLPEVAPLPIGTSRDATLLIDPTADVHRRYVAGACMAVRQHGGDIAAATAATLALVESEQGPATGPRHAARIDHCRHSVEYALRTFDPAKCGRGRRRQGPEYTPRFDDSHVKWAANVLARRLSKRLHDTGISKIKAGKALCVYIDCIHQFAGQVSRDAIVEFAGVTKAEAAILYRVFADDASGLLVQTRGHSKGRHSRVFVLHNRCPLPNFIEASTAQRAMAALPRRVVRAINTIGEPDDVAELFFMAEQGFAELPDGRFMLGNEMNFTIIEFKPEVVKQVSNQPVTDYESAKVVTGEEEGFGEGRTLDNMSSSWTRTESRSAVQTTVFDRKIAGRTYKIRISA